MTVFAPTTDPNTAQGLVVGNMVFWPSISVDDFRAAMRLQDSVSDQRVIQAIRTSLREINPQLSVWRDTQKSAGHTSLSEVPGDDYGINEPNALLHHYLTAVYSQTKALLIEEYPDVDSTASGKDRGTEFHSTKDNYQRECIEAIRMILGVGRTTVELI